MSAPLPPRLTVNEVADRLRISVTSVGRFVASGDLASIRLGRRVLIDEADLDDFVNRHKSGGRSA